MVRRMTRTQQLHVGCCFLSLLWPRLGCPFRAAAKTARSRTVVPPFVPYVCDPQNIPECNYDGGDCCSCTCEDTPSRTCGQYGGFACIDPSAECVDDDDITVDMIDACDYVGGIGETC